MDRSPSPNEAGNSAADKLLRTLSAFKQQSVWDLAPLATYLNIPKSTTHRILQDLRRHGYVRQLPESPKYALGYQFAILGNTTSPSTILCDIVRPSLERLASLTQETACFVVLDRQQLLVLDVVESPSAIRFALQVGAHFPLYRGSAGRILLAHSSKDLRRSVLRSLGVSTRAAIEAELEHIRSTGWAYTADEVNAGAAALAVPVFGSNGKVIGCLTAGGPVARMNREVAVNLIPALHKEAGHIVHQLGGEEGKWS